MNADITVSLSSETLGKAAAWSARSGRPVAELIAEIVEQSISPLVELPKDFENWPDSLILNAMNVHLSRNDDQRLSRLLNQQQNASLNSGEAKELQLLMSEYREKLLLKSAALAEAVRRGLVPSLAP